MTTNNALSVMIPDFDRGNIMTIKRRKGKLYFEWRNAVYERDDYTCQHCLTKEDIVPHHVIPWNDSFELRLVVDNGITLCRPCHMRHHAKGNKNSLGKVSWKKGLKVGKGGPKKGTKLTLEHRIKLSAAKKANPNSSLHCTRLATARIGIPLTDEHRAKLSERTRAYWERKRNQGVSELGN